ncbi:MAG: hypothetical protein KGN84_16630 [Acidobacteriota bacterium]|nr:hypothetical protein [Acidobacteriota bacterium]
MYPASRALAALFLGAICAAAQTAPAGATPLNLTVNYPSGSVVSTMFGTLPKDVALVEVTACNDTPSALLIANGRLVQALRKNGIQALSRDAAIATMQSSENRTWQKILLRNATHGMNIVNFLVISKAVALGPALSEALPSVQALLEAIVPEFARDVPDHQYLNFDHDTLPDKIQLNPLDCATGLMFTMKPSGKAASTAELTVAVPSIAGK